MRSLFYICCILLSFLNYFYVFGNEISIEERKQLKEKVIEMFDHAYNSYMKYAYPADELMPLSCRGRYRDSHSSRGDIDEVLGNYTLTLVDTLDTLALLGKLDELEQAVLNVIQETKFDADLIISVFESNIRMLGGLLSGHVSVIYMRNKHPDRFKWYNDELLDMAKDLGNRLLPAFNTSTGLPMSRINLKKGITADLLASEKDKFTCTACAGTLLLEFVTLSRLTGDNVFEEKVTKTMDYLWEKRNKVSDLVGTVINVNDGEWQNKDSSIGAGIDSYYEYLFKGYILTGDENLLYRFNKHYDSINKYMSLNSNGYENEIGDGPSMKTVHMHMPNRQARNYIDALLAFWPGIQVLKGDLKGAIKMHESLNQIVQKHDFLPEAVLFDHSVHWSSHPLRPEFLESTYYLYRATKDDYYLQIAKKMLDQLEKYSRVKCGYAALSDVKTKQHEDRVDSFFYAETFKYLYLIFAEEDDTLPIDVNDFLFTTEAHLIPLNMNPYMKKELKKKNGKKKRTLRKNNILEYDRKLTTKISESCPSLKVLFGSNVYDESKKVFNLTDETQRLRDSISRNSNEEKCAQHNEEKLQINFNLDKLKSIPLRAGDFVAGRKDHVEILKRLGVKVTTMSDGRIQLVHKSSEAGTLQEAEMGILFMTEMLELSKQQNLKSNVLMDEYRSLSVVILSMPFRGLISYPAGPAQFGYDFRKNNGLFGRLLLANPFDGCSNYNLTDSMDFTNKIIIAKRGNCMFIDKARIAESYGAVGLIIIDNVDESSYQNSPLFAMSGDGSSNVKLPSLFLFGREAKYLLDNFLEYNDMIVFVGDSSSNGVEKSIQFNTDQLKFVLNKNKNKKCQIKNIFNIKKQEKICDSNDYRNLKYYFELNAQTGNENQESNSIQRINLDESIQINLYKNKTKTLVINIEFIKALIDIPNDGKELAKRIFNMLISRLEQKTNFEIIDNVDLFKSALLNYVNFSINNTDLSENDQLLLEQLAYVLDFKNN